MKHPVIRKIFGFILLFALLLEMGVLCWEALTPGKQSAAQSGAVGDIVDDVITDVVGDDEVKDVPPESVSILSGGKQVEEVVVGIGNSLRLDAKILPADTSANHLKVFWESDDSSVVSVNNGTLKGVGLGTATVTVTLEYDSHLTASILVTVNEIFAESFTLTFADGKTEATVYEGKTAALSAKLTPTNTTAKTLTYTTSDKSVATVASNGVVRGIATGDAIITAKYRSRTPLNGEYVEFSAAVTVHVEVDPDPFVPVPPTGLTLVVPDEVESVDGVNTVYVGTEGKFGCTIAPADCTDTLLVWSSSDSEILEINSQGAFTALKKGSVTVRVTSASVPTLFQEIELRISNRSLDVVIGMADVEEPLIPSEGTGEFVMSVRVGSSVPLSITSSVEDIYIRYETSDVSRAEISEDGTLLTYTAGKNVMLTVIVADNEAFSNEDGNLCETYTIRLTVTRQPFSTTVKNWAAIVRKIFGHFGAFLVLGLLAGSTAACFDKKNWPYRLLVLVFLVLYGFAFAGLTEILQLPIFTAGRGPSFGDVMIDYYGFLPGLFAVYGVYLLIVLLVECVQDRKKHRMRNE